MGRCALCGAETWLTTEHIVPQAFYRALKREGINYWDVLLTDFMRISLGRNEPYNITYTCWKCNTAKGCKLPTLSLALKLSKEPEVMRLFYKEFVIRYYKYFSTWKDIDVNDLLS